MAHLEMWELGALGTRRGRGAPGLRGWKFYGGALGQDSTDSSSSDVAAPLPTLPADVFGTGLTPLEDTGLVVPPMLPAETSPYQPMDDTTLLPQISSTGLTPPSSVPAAQIPAAGLTPPMAIAPMAPAAVAAKPIMPSYTPGQIASTVALQQALAAAQRSQAQGASQSLITALLAPQPPPQTLWQKVAPYATTVAGLGIVGGIVYALWPRSDA